MKRTDLPYKKLFECMIKIELKLQPKGEPKKVDGLLWGGAEPEKFLSMAEKRDGLIGHDIRQCFVASSVRL